jgi:hypothetical protein
MWIESHQSLRNHPKVKKAARLAGVNEFEMIGRLHCLWWWALDYAPDGDLTNYSAEDIESAVDWTGPEGAFYTALIDCGFNGHCGLIEKLGEQTTIHDWHEYGGRLLQKREANKDRMREARAMHVQNTTIARTGATEQTEHTEQNKQKRTRIAAAKPPTPPQIEAYRHAAHRYPNKSLYPLICEHVKDDSQSLLLFEQIVTGWIAKGWNPANITGILEFVDRGEVPQGNGQNGNGQKSNAVAALERLKEKHGND